MMRRADCHPERKHLSRGMCRQCYDAAYIEANRAARNASARRWQSKVVRSPADTRRRRYGISVADQEAMLEAQNGLCKLCGVRAATELDHDHATGRVRGFLCGACNSGLGLFRDSAVVLRSAALYVLGVEPRSPIAPVWP